MQINCVCSVPQLSGLLINWQQVGCQLDYCQLISVVYDCQIYSVYTSQNQPLGYNLRIFLVFPN